jgi:hypothetical protein
MRKMSRGLIHYPDLSKGAVNLKIDRYQNVCFARVHWSPRKDEAEIDQLIDVEKMSFRIDDAGVAAVSKKGVKDGLPM